MATFLYTPEGTQQLTTELASLAKPLVLFCGFENDQYLVLRVQGYV